MKIDLGNDFVVYYDSSIQQDSRCVQYYFNLDGSPVTEPGEQTVSGYVDLKSLRCQNQISKQFEGTLPANLTNILPSAEDQTTLIELLASQTFEAVSQFVHKCGCQYYGEKQLPAVRGREEEFLIAAIQHAQNGEKAPTDKIFDTLRSGRLFATSVLHPTSTPPTKLKP